MTELNPIDVLADLFEDAEFILAGTTLKATLTMNRLRDAGFVMMDAKRFAALEAALEAAGKGTE